MQTNIRNTVAYEKNKYREIFDVEESENKLKIYIKSNLSVYDVVPVGRVEIEREEFCAARVSFTALKDDMISFNQGDAVSVKWEKQEIFLGYVFSKSRDKKGLIDVCCYDQMRYLKNRRTYTRGRMSLDEIVYKIAADCSLRVGEVEKSTAVLPGVAAENISLLDVLKKACKDTFSLSGKRFMLYDDCGYLMLKNEDDMATDVLIDSTAAENFVYKDTIDHNVYNTIEIYSDTKKQNLRTITKVSDKETIDEWGELVLSKKAVDPQRAYEEGENLLKEYNRVNRQIIIKGVNGDERILPGGRVYVRLEMGDLSLDGYMRVEKAIHVFENNVYKTDIYLDGSEIG